MPSLLSITDLHVSIEDKEVVKGITLTINEGEVHAIMGPNGSGKSSLVSALMGHPRYVITKGSVQFKGEDLLSLPPDERAKRGLFLAFQYPKEIAGVTLKSFLLVAHRAQLHDDEKRLSPMQFQKLLLAEMETLKMDPAFADRSLNQGFSGGEKKKAEILQMKILRPRLALLDETDSGLDVDALKVVADGVNSMRTTPSTRERVFVPAAKDDQKLQVGRPAPMVRRPAPTDKGKDFLSFSALIVTHYARILEHITPDHVHVMVAGKIVESGGPELARELEKEGYRKYGETPKSAAVRLELE